MGDEGGWKWEGSLLLFVLELECLCEMFACELEINFWFVWENRFDKGQACGKGKEGGGREGADGVALL